MPVISKSQAIRHSRAGASADYYQLSEVLGGTTIALADFSGEHGERTIGDRPRVYFVLSGSGEFLINGEKIEVHEGDVVTIPPKGTYNLWPKGGAIKVLLISELLNLENLPK